MKKIIKFGVEFNVSTIVDDGFFMELLNSEGFKVVFENIEKEKKNIEDKSAYYTSEAAKAAEYGKWNHKTPEEYAELINIQLKKITQLLIWEVKDGWCESDNRGNSYSQWGYDGLRVTNRLLNVSYYFR